MPKKKTPTASAQDVALLGVNYIALKQEQKRLDDEAKAIRPVLENYLEQNLSEDSKGHQFAVVMHADKEVILQKTLRVGSVLRAEALDVLKELNLHECIETVEVVREDVVEQLHAQGKITDKQLSRIFAMKKNYAFSVKLNDKFDVEETA